MYKNKLGSFLLLHQKVNLCSQAFSVFQLSQGSVATLIRWGRWY